MQQFSSTKEINRNVEKKKKTRKKKQTKSIGEEKLNNDKHTPAWGILEKQTYI